MLAARAYQAEYVTSWDVDLAGAFLILDFSDRRGCYQRIQGGLVIPEILNKHATYPALSQIPCFCIDAKASRYWGPARSCSAG